IDEGATVAFGGGRPDLNRGYYVEPTLFTDAKNSMAIAQDEIFGPVAAVIPFSTVDEAIGIANDSRYGLCSWVWSRDVTKAYEIGKRLRGGGGNVKRPLRVRQYSTSR